MNLQALLEKLTKALEGLSIALDRKKLVQVLIEVESEGDDFALGDIHLKDKAFGPLQIRQPCVDDVNRAFGSAYTAHDCYGDRKLSIWIFQRYMDLYATPARIGRRPTMEDMSRIWNGGPAAWVKPQKDATREAMLSAYWAKVQKHL